MKYPREKICVNCKTSFTAHHHRNEKCEECKEKERYSPCRNCQKPYLDPSKEWGSYGQQLNGEYWSRSGYCSFECFAYVKAEQYRQWYENAVFIAPKKVAYGTRTNTPPASLNPKLRKSIVERDDKRCANVNCGYKWRVEVHHIDSDRKNNHWNNLITLCKTCHGYVTKHQIDVQKYYKSNAKHKPEVIEDF
jgi:hypothetical protein